MTDMTPLVAMPNLKRLVISDCPVAKAAVGPSVTTLDLSATAITDWSPLASSDVHSLIVRRNGITDLSPFVAIKALDNGGGLDVLENPYDCKTQITNIWALQQRGVSVKQDCQP